MTTNKTIQIMSIPADESRPVELRKIDSGLSSMQAEVGGNIECLETETFDLWTNEEGRLVGLPTNHRAIRLTAQVGPLAGWGYLHHLLGDVCYQRRNVEKGDEKMWYRVGVNRQVITSDSVHTWPADIRPPSPVY